MANNTSNHSDRRGYSCLLFFIRTKRGVYNIFICIGFSARMSKNLTTNKIYCSIGIIACQSMQRRVSAEKLIKELRRERRDASSILIQTKWRSTLARKEFISTVSKLTLVQSTIRRWTAARSFDQTKKAATLISYQWRRLHFLLAYKKTRNSKFIYFVDIQYKV